MFSFCCCSLFMIFLLSMLSAARRSEQFLLICRSVNREVIPLNAAFVEADTALGKADQVVFAFFQLEGVDKMII